MRWICLAVVLSCMSSLTGFSHGLSQFELEVLVHGIPVPQYHHNGRVYIEALRNQEYSIRVTNPLNRRAAVALAVDGLNTIDADRTAAAGAKKWVIEPYGSITLSGWQINQQQARHFFFTTEEKSYGQWLGKTENLGIISAVFFQERVPLFVSGISRQEPKSDSRERKSVHKEVNRQSSADFSRSAPEAASSQPRSQRKETYAATGIGKKLQHNVQWVSIDLDPIPVATLNLRYEFRPVLVSMGILPAHPGVSPLARRENASGFADSRFCPDPR